MIKVRKNTLCDDLIAINIFDLLFYVKQMTKRNGLIQPMILERNLRQFCNIHGIHDLRFLNDIQIPLSTQIGSLLASERQSRSFGIYDVVDMDVVIAKEEIESFVRNQENEELSNVLLSFGERDYMALDELLNPFLQEQVKDARKKMHQEEDQYIIVCDEISFKMDETKAEKQKIQKEGL